MQRSDRGPDAGTAAAIERLADAWARHDLETFLECFAPDYESTQPLFPDRSFRGREQVRDRWAVAFTRTPDFRADLLAMAVGGATAWTEWHWHGTRPDGSHRDERGVIVYTVRDGRIVAGRVYMAEGPEDSSRS